MRSLSPGRALVVPLAALALVAACSTDPAASPETDGASSSTAATDLPTALEPLWTADADAPSLVTPDVLVRSSSKSVEAINAETGEQYPVFTPPAGTSSICETSPQVSNGHLLGLLLDAPRHPCTIAAALDLRTGKLRWRQDIPGNGPYHEGRAVAVSSTTLLATVNCDQMSRLSLRNGRILSVIAPKDRKCANETATDGTVVVALDDPETEATPDDRGTGVIPPSDAPGAFDLYDASSGKRRWRHPIANTRAGGVTAVVQSDPLVLTTTEGGHTVTRLWSDTGRPGPVVGLSPDKQEGMRVLGRTGNVLVATYPYTNQVAVYFGYDLTTGEEAWQFLAPSTPGTQTTVSLDNDALLVGVGSPQGVALINYPIADGAAPGSPEVLGLAPGTSPVGHADGLVVTSGGAGLSAVAVPATGEAIEPDALDTLITGLFTPVSSDPTTRWENGDIRPRDVTYACTAVSRATLELAGLDWSGLPTPADCHWAERYRPNYLERELSVAVTVQSPGYSTDGDLTATEAAMTYAENVAGITSDDRAKLVELDADHSLGDQAWGLFVDPSGDSFGGHPVRMVTRWRNVVVEVTANQAVELESRMVDAAPFSRLQDAVYAATSEVLQRLGADVPTIARGADGPVTEVSDVCQLLRVEATDLVPDQRPAGQRPGDGQSVCSWGTAHADLTVLAYAVAGGADGTPADERAAEVAGILPAARGRALEGVPGTNVYSRYTGSKGDYRSRTLTTYVDNLVVWVDVTISRDAPAAEALDADIVRIARKVVRANT